jgi:hypothetical protein
MKSSVRLKIVRSVDKEVAAKVNNIIRVTENLTEEFTASEKPELQKPRYRAG